MSIRISFASITPTKNEAKQLQLCSVQWWPVERRKKCYLEKIKKNFRTQWMKNKWKHKTFLLANGIAVILACNKQNHMYPWTCQIVLKPSSISHFSRRTRCHPMTANREKDWTDSEERTGENSTTTTYNDDDDTEQQQAVNKRAHLFIRRVSSIRPLWMSLHIFYSLYYSYTNIV